MDQDQSFVEEMARELDNTIRRLSTLVAALNEALGDERLAELEDYQNGHIDVEVAFEGQQFERSLDARDLEWLSVSARLRRARKQRVAVGQLCMRRSVLGRGRE